MAAQKKTLSPAQRAALDRGRAKRQANIKGRRAGHARQAASAQVEDLLSLANEQTQQAVSAALPTVSGPSSSGTSKLSQAEQDALLFDFAMGEDEGGEAEAESSGGAKPKHGLGDRLSGLLLNEAPKAKLGGVTDQQEEDAQQAAAQWTNLVSVALIFIAGLVVSQELAPSERQARAMAAPLCRIIMRHVDPLRTASADVYDAAAFGGAVLVYVQAIQPELARRRAERKVVSPSAVAAKREERAAERGAAERGNVRILYSETPDGSGRYDTEPGQAGRDAVREQEHQPYVSDAGAAIIDEALGIQF